MKYQFFPESSCNSGLKAYVNVSRVRQVCVVPHPSNDNWTLDGAEGPAELGTLLPMLAGLFVGEKNTKIYLVGGLEHFYTFLVSHILGIIIPID